MEPGEYRSAVRCAVESYLARDFDIIHLPYGSKNPNAPDWGTANRVTADNIETVLSGVPRNVGMLLGSLADVDLDCEEAILAAPWLLPSTGLRHGRPSKPVSHYWYECAAPYRKFNDPIDGATLLELRGGGDGKQRQTVIPPSFHATDDESYRWEELANRL